MAIADRRLHGIETVVNLVTQVNYALANLGKAPIITFGVLLQGGGVGAQVVRGCGVEKAINDYPQHRDDNNEQHGTHYCADYLHRLGAVFEDFQISGGTGTICRYHISGGGGGYVGVEDEEDGASLEG